MSKSNKSFCCDINLTFNQIFNLNVKYVGRLKFHSRVVWCSPGCVDCGVDQLLSSAFLPSSSSQQVQQVSQYVACSDMVCLGLLYSHSLTLNVTTDLSPLTLRHSD